MWAAGLSAFAALLGLHTIGVQGETFCHVNHLVTDWSLVDLSKVHESLAGPVAELCTQGLRSDKSKNNNYSNVIIYNTGDVTFKIKRERSAQNAEDCKTAFASIVLQCIGRQNFASGLVRNEIEGVVYEVYHVVDRPMNGQKEKIERVLQQRDENDPGLDNSLGARAPKGSKGASTSKSKSKSKTPKAKPKPKPKPKPNPNPNPKPKPKTTPNPKSSKATKTSSSKASKTSSTGRPGPTKSCKQIYALLVNDLKEEDLALEKEEVLVGRGEYAGGMTHIEKRTSKRGRTCKLAVNALDYPNTSQMPAAAKYYGFQTPELCENLVFPAGMQIPAKGHTQKDYQIEHVLEWQVVTKFFTWLEENKLKGEIFNNPSPTAVDKDKNRKKIYFCLYWKTLWQDSPIFQIKGKGESRKAFEHLKYAYPGIGNHDDEFIYLQSTVNAPAKSGMWAPDSSTKGVYGDASEWRRGKEHIGMTDLIQGVKKPKAAGKIKARAANIDDARKALLKLKWLMGAREYLKVPPIAAILKKQKNRIGNILDNLDTEMEKHQLDKGRKGGILDAWKRQDLKAKWDDYMNYKFNLAKSRCTHDMDKFLPMLERQWAPKGQQLNNDQVVLFAQIKKVKAAWVAEKASSWDAPW